jgi:hypothetical protein
LRAHSEVRVGSRPPAAKAVRTRAVLLRNEPKFSAASEAALKRSFAGVEFIDENGLGRACGPESP